MTVAKIDEAWHRRNIMSTLQDQIRNLSQQFLSSVLIAIRQASITELAEYRTADGLAPSRRGRAITPSGRRGGRRKRSSSEEIEQLKLRTLEAAKALKANFSKGDVMRKTGSSVDLGRALTLLVTEGKLRKQGERRLTRYSLK
jgi:hypothetical protein